METLVKVWNRNTHPFKQKFRGNMIEIPAGGFIEMDFYDAHSFKSKGSPIEKDGQGRFKPESFKKIEVEGRPNFSEQAVVYKCQADGSFHATEEAMIQHSKQYEARRVKDKPKVEKSA
jgi:hypothetical protein